MNSIQQIGVETDPNYFMTKGMTYKEFNSHYSMIRYYALLVVQKCPPGYSDISLLEQQVSEIIKNAIKHGNKSDPKKIVKVWYTFEPSYIKIIVADEGSGFHGIEEWNSFQKKRAEAVSKGDFDDILKYASFKHENSSADDGGNALFAAVEYWNGGYVFNAARNTVCATKILAQQSMVRQA